MFGSREIRTLNRECALNVKARTGTGREKRKKQILPKKMMRWGALGLFSAGKDIKAAHQELRKRHGRCSRRTVELAFKAWEKNNIAPGKAKPEASPSAKADSEKPAPSDVGEAKRTSEITSEFATFAMERELEGKCKYRDVFSIL